MLIERRRMALPPRQSVSCVEHSPHLFWAECSDKGPLTQYLRPNIRPIYHCLLDLHKKHPMKRYFLLDM